MCIRERIITIIISTCLGIEYSHIQQDIVKTITTMAVPILIVLSVGVLVGSWMISGTVPLMIYYGMKVLSPSLFLVMVCVVCTLMSVMAGTSWGTISTCLLYTSSFNSSGDWKVI